MNDRPVYELQLRAERWLSDEDDPKATRRMRAALKWLLRSCGLRCIRIVDLSAVPCKPLEAEDVSGPTEAEGTT